MDGAPWLRRTADAVKERDAAAAAIGAEVFAGELPPPMRTAQADGMSSAAPLGGSAPLPSTPHPPPTPLWTGSGRGNQCRIALVLNARVCT